MLLQREPRRAFARPQDAYAVCPSAFERLLAFERELVLLPVLRQEEDERGDVGAGRFVALPGTLRGLAVDGTNAADNLRVVVVLFVRQSLARDDGVEDRKSTRLNSSHTHISR